MRHWRFTLDHSDAFYANLGLITRHLECDTVSFLGAANAESGVWASAQNPASTATGLLQWMRPHYEKWGYTRAEFAALSADAQLVYVRRYLDRFRGRLSSAGVIYTAIFLPAFVDQAADPNFVLCARGEKLGWAYAANAVFDANGDGRITVAELELAIRRNWGGPRCEEMLARANVDAPDWSLNPDAEDLRTTIGVQRKLIRLGYDLGAMGADGIPGMRTRNAVIAFQKAHNIDAIGVVGPRTRAALLAA